MTASGSTRSCLGSCRATASAACWRRRPSKKASATRRWSVPRSRSPRSRSTSRRGSWRTRSCSWPARAVAPSPARPSPWMAIHACLPDVRYDNQRQKRGNHVMTLDRRTLLAASAGTLLVGRPARAQRPVLKIGVLNDQSGVYRDDTGPTGVICARQAVDEFAASLPGVDIQVIAADHQNKADIGVGIARQWFDQDGVDVIVDVPTSSVALAVSTVCREKNKLMLNSGAATTDLTGSQCSPNTIQWTYDTYMLAKSTGGATVRAGGDTWYFITANYVFGQQL